MAIAQSVLEACSYRSKSSEGYCQCLFTCPDPVRAIVQVCSHVQIQWGLLSKLLLTCLVAQVQALCVTLNYAFQSLSPGLFYVLDDHVWSLCTCMQNVNPVLWFQYPTVRRTLTPKLPFHPGLQGLSRQLLLTERCPASKQQQNLSGCGCSYAQKSYLNINKYILYPCAANRNNRKSHYHNKWIRFYCFTGGYHNINCSVRDEQTEVSRTINSTMSYLVNDARKQTTVCRLNPSPMEKLERSGKFSTVLWIKNLYLLCTGGKRKTLHTHTQQQKSCQWLIHWKGKAKNIISYFSCIQTK